MKRIATICGWGALAIVLLFALVMAVASPVAKYVINNYGEQILGRQTHVERVVINPFWGGVTLRGFECKEANGHTGFVMFERLYVQIAWPQLIGRHVTVRHIHLDGFRGQVLKSDNRLNFSDIVERFASGDSVPRDTTPSSWTVALRDIRIRRSAIRYRDVVSDKQWNLNDISLHVPGLYFDNTQTNAGLEFGLPTGGRVGIQAGYKMQSNRYTVRLSLYDVHTDVVLPLVQDYLDITGLGAVLNGTMYVDGSLDNVQNIRLRGHLAMQGLSLRDKSDHEIAALDRLRVVIERGDVAENVYILDTLMLSGLTGSYEVHDNWNTLSRLAKEPQATDSAALGTPDGETDAQNTPPAQKPMEWLAKAVRIDGHDLCYHDYSMKHKWDYAIRTLRVEGTNIASNGRNSVTLSATLTGDARLKADFVGGPDLKNQDTRLDMKLTGVRLSDFDALCRNYTGYPLNGGELSLESHADVTKARLTGSNKIVIDKPRVGKRERLTRAPYKNIPVKAGFALLTSAQDMIVLDVPVTGDVSNPKFKLGKVIGRAVLKVFFGPLMGVQDKKNGISGDELREMQSLLGEDAPALPADSTAVQTTDSLGEDAVGHLQADVAVTARDSIRLAEIGQE